MFTIRWSVFVVCLVLLLWQADLGRGQLELCKNFVTTLDFDTLTVGKKKLVYFAQEKSWDDAFAACQKIGMRLVTIQNDEENQALFQFLHNRVWGVGGKPYDYTYWYMWSSGKHGDGENFVWKSTGQNVTYTAWGDEEPNGGTSESCIELRYISWEKLFWNDSLCWIKKRYICEAEHGENPSFE